MHRWSRRWRGSASSRGRTFDITKLDPAVARGLKVAPKAAQGAIMGHFKHAGIEVNGWQVMTKTGIYGTDYLQRAFVTAIGLGANRPQDAVYPTSIVDADGKPYDGANKYVMHFPKGQTPPAQGFWSLTMYDADYFFVANSLNRSTVSSRYRFPIQSRRIARSLHPGSLSGQGQGVELASRSRREVHPDATPLLASGDSPLDHRWLLEAARRDEGQVRTTSIPFRGRAEGSATAGLPRPRSSGASATR